MSRFKGKNGLGTKELFYSRLNYAVSAHPAGQRSQPIKDFHFSEKTMYGRIDKRHQPIILNNFFLKPIKSQAGSRSGPLRAVNFVVDAFEALVLEFKKAAFAGKLDDSDTNLYNISAKKAFLDPNTRYKQYVESLRNLFLNDFLNNHRKLQIKGFNTFMPLFTEFLSTMSQVDCITKSAFVPSTYCSPLVSGLTIYITNLDASDDSLKGDFINSRNFEFYKIAAAKHGFSIDSNAPWKLIADIAGEGMLKYARRYGLNTENQILNNYYQPAYNRDIEDFQLMALSFYNAFVARNPRTRSVDSAGDVAITCRLPTTLREVVDQYDSQYWLDKYIDIKYNELRKPGSEGKLTNLKKDVNTALRIGGVGDSLFIINDTLRGFDNYNGSFAKQSAKVAYRDIGILTKPTY
tara:strand:+ start:745 stop:1962 length:1218 start_codon:yes stop_codon:yes gene_type:complete